MKRKQTKKTGSSKQASPYFNPYERPNTAKQKPKKPVTSKQKTTSSTKVKKTYKVDEYKSPELRRKALKKNNKLSKAQIERNRKRKQRRFRIKLMMMVLVTAFGVWSVLKI